MNSKNPWLANGREAFQPPGSLVPVDVFYERKKAGTGSNQ